MVDDRSFRKIGGRGRCVERERATGPDVECFFGGGIVGLREAAGQDSGEGGRNHGHKEMEETTLGIV